MVFSQWTEGERSDIPNTHTLPLPSYFWICSPMIVQKSWHKPQDACCSSGLAFKTLQSLFWSRFQSSSLSASSNSWHCGHTDPTITFPIWVPGCLCCTSVNILHIIQDLNPKAAFSSQTLWPPGRNKICPPFRFHGISKVRESRRLFSQLSLWSASASKT